MFVLHAHWQPAPTPKESSGMLFWAEQSELRAKPSTRGRKGKDAPHPFCADATQVAQLLKQAAGFEQVIVAREVSLLLPTGKSGALPSPQLLHEWEIDSESPALTATALTATKVSGCWFSPVQTFTVLTRLTTMQEGASTLRLGDDLRFWSVAAGLVLELMAQQKVLPTLAEEADQKFVARWQPILDAPKDAPRLARLLAAMPPLCRASADSAEHPPHAQALLDSFLNIVSDAAMRQYAQPAAQALNTRQDSAAYAWLQALFSPTAQIKSNAAQLKRLLTSHSAWTRNLQMAGDRHFRVAFRLEAPTATPDKKHTQPDWSLHFLLQARDDPSLLAPAELVWQTRGNILNTLGRHFEQPQEKLLTGLGYAARLFEPLHRSLQSAKPLAAQLSVQEAFTFLRQSAALLEDSGFGVLVPPWWNSPNSKLRLKMKVRSKQKKGNVTTSGGMTLDSLLKYNWELSIGDTTLSRQEFDALVALKSPLVEIRGQWVQLDSQQIEAAINFWQKHSRDDELSLQDALNLGLGADTVDGLAVESIEYEGWLKQWMAQFTRSEQLTVLDQPKSLHATLRSYQQYGYSWLDFMRRWQVGVCLADDMGLGKTIQTLAMLLREQEEKGKLPAPTLLICPTSVVMNWAKEVDKFAPSLTVHVHQGMERLRGADFVAQAKQVDLLITSYPLLRRDEEMLNQLEWFGVVLDEAQNIKNAETKQARTIRQLTSAFRLALTGTPVENRLSELWSIMNFLNPGFLGSQKAFRQSFALPIEREQDADAIQRLRRLVSPFILRRLKTDPTVIQDLPEKQEMKVYCHLSEEQATLYEAVVREALEAINSAEEGIARRGQVLAMLMKLKQICNHPAQFLHQVSGGKSGQSVKGKQVIDLSALGNARSGKLLRLVEMLEEITATGDRVLLFTQFAEMGHLLRSYLQNQLGIATQFLHGGTPASQRTAMVERFQNEADAPPIFILSLKAGGVGLNLTRANHVFHFDRWWNPAVENQATDRAFRIGQKRNVQVHKFVCVGTLEEKIDEMIERKKALAESVVGTGENWLTELSTDNLRQMVTLRREVMAVSEQ